MQNQIENQIEVKKTFLSFQSLSILVSRPAVALTLALIPFGILAAFVARFTIDIPFGDQWDFIPLLDKASQGRVTPYDLWTQHNEHRLFFPRLVMLALAGLSGWNVRLEMVFSILLAIGIFAVLAYQTRLTLRAVVKEGHARASDYRVNWLIPILALVVFSLNQWENWAWGWQLQIPMNTLAVVGGIALLANPQFKWSKLVGAIAIGLVATYSFANGMFYWFVGLVVIFFVTRSNGRVMRLALGSWVIASLIVIVTYFLDYTKPAESPSPFVIFQNPVGFVMYVLAYLGSPISNINISVTIAAGLVGVIGQAYAVWTLVWRRGLNFQLLLPYLGMSLYAIISAMVTGVGRLGFGTQQAATPRYITTSELFWVANFVFIYLLLTTRQAEAKTQKAAGNRAAIEKYAVMAGLAIFLLLSVFSSYRGGRAMMWRYDNVEPVRAAFAAGKVNELDSEMIRRINLDENLVRSRWEIVQKHKWSVFR